ncbi:hypothetical protein CRE_15047 [Caenorhabditis remanei]|uniref:Integrator complex subunit 5 N-terminal domain-containing protein n=1 Tax=Caenorhabditis remanei TaxID=31234 RepID=E3NL88_CAERE|nr:hypothetical protein CRE_15047 [Caenorhabditis remanei]
MIHFQQSGELSSILVAWKGLFEFSRHSQHFSWIWLQIETFTQESITAHLLESGAAFGSLADKFLVLGDHLCDVDGVPVTDKGVARDLLVKNIQGKGNVSFVVERPDCIEEKQWAKNALAANILTPPSIIMTDDVRSIAAKYRQELKGLKGPEKSVMSVGGGPSGRKVYIVEETATNEIGHDHERKALRKGK